MTRSITPEDGRTGSTSPAVRFERPTGGTTGPADGARLSRHDWLAMLSLSLGAFVVVAAEFVCIGILPQLSAELDVTLGTAGLTVLVPGLVAGLSAPLLVVWSARWDRRHLVLALGLLLLVSSVVAALTPTFEVLLAARVLVGLSLGGFWAVVPSMGFRMAPPGSGPVATSVILAGISVGTVIGLPAGQFVGAMWGWRAAFWATAALSVVVLAAQALLVPHVAATAGLRFAAFGKVLRSPIARVGYVATVLVVIGQFAASTFISPFLMGPAALPPAALTALFTAYGVAGFLGTLLGGRLIVRRPIGTTVGAMACLSGAVALTAILADQALGVAVTVACWGLAWGMVPLTLQTWTIRALPEASEAASAVLVCVFQVSIAAGALVGGALVDRAGLRVDFAVAAATVLAGAIYTAATSRVVNTREP